MKVNYKKIWKDKKARLIKTGKWAAYLEKHKIYTRRSYAKLHGKSTEDYRSVVAKAVELKRDAIGNIIHAEIT